MTSYHFRLVVAAAVLMLPAVSITACGSSKDKTNRAAAKPKLAPAADGSVKRGKNKGTIRVGVGGAGTTASTAGHDKVISNKELNRDVIVVPFVGIDRVVLGMTRAQAEEKWKAPASEATQNSADGGPPTTRLNYGKRSVLLDSGNGKVILIDTTSAADAMSNGLHVGSRLASVKAAEPQADCADATPGPGVCRLDNGSGAITDFIMVNGKVSRLSIGLFRD